MNTTEDKKQLGNEEEEINIIDYLRVLKKHLKLIIILFIGVIIFTFIFSLLSPKIYQARASLLPPTTTGKTEIPASLAASLGVEIPFLSPIYQSTTNKLIAILKSRRMQDAIVEEFNLVDRYKVKYIEDARKILEKNTKIKETKENVIEVYVESEDKYLAKDIANFYVEYLDQLNKKLAQSSARQARLFTEERLEETREKLKQAEEDLENFRRSKKIVEIDAQAKALIEASSRLEAELSACQVELKVMQYYAKENYPEVEKLKLKIKELKNKLDTLTRGGSSAGSSKNIYPGYSQVPRLSTELGRLLRRVKIQENLFTLLTQMYEKIKIEEVKDTPTIQVLDYACLPEKPIKPKIKLNLMISGVLSLFIGVFLAFFLEYLSKVKR
jgi:uncharacterized protein involved in exopolysaccharide biosynthesis